MAKKKRKPTKHPRPKSDHEMTADVLDKMKAKKPKKMKHNPDAGY